MYNAANYISCFVSVRVKCLADVVLLGLKKFKSAHLRTLCCTVGGGKGGGSYQAMKRMEHVESNHRLISHEASHLPTVM